MSTSFIGANHLIPLERAKKLTGFFKTEKDRLINPGLGKKDIIPFSETFDRGAIDDLLKLEGCVGIRIYTGLDEEFKLRLILVGVDKEGKDLIIPSTTEGLSIEEGGLVVEDGVRCPPHCSEESPLNP